LETLSPSEGRTARKRKALSWDL